jgi:hypothetical protein
MMGISNVLYTPEDAAMNWFDNVSSDCDRPIAAARLMQGHWQHRLHPFAEPALCRVVIDTAAPRVVAAQKVEHGLAEDLGSSELEDLSMTLAAQEVFARPSAWGFSACPKLPSWARPSFSESQIEELERIQGYLIDATEDTIDSVLQLREQFMRGIGLNDQDISRAGREPQHGQPNRKGGRMAS